MFILGKLHTIRNMIILIQKPKIRFIFNSQKPKNSVISTNICKIIIKLLSILVPNQTNFVTAKCHLDPANLNSQTRPQSHEFNNIHTHTHTQTKLRIWKHQQFGNQQKNYSYSIRKRLQRNTHTYT